jgi:hypothetical protein
MYSVPDFNTLILALALRFSVPLVLYYTPFSF